MLAISISRNQENVVSQHFKYWKSRFQIYVDWSVSLTTAQKCNWDQWIILRLYCPLAASWFYMAANGSAYIYCSWSNRVLPDPRLNKQSPECGFCHRFMLSWEYPSQQCTQWGSRTVGSAVLQIKKPKRIVLLSNQSWARCDLICLR